jgi:hypothetical protein
VIGFVDHLYTPLRTTSDYSAIADIHNSEISSLQSSIAIPKQRLLTVEIFELSVPPLQSFFLTPQHGPHRQHHFPHCVRNRCHWNVFT